MGLLLWPKQSTINKHASYENDHSSQYLYLQRAVYY